MGKDRFAAHTRRFANVPTGPSLYAAELSTGIVKIGCTTAAQGRLMSLASEARRDHSAELCRFHVVPRATKVGGRRAEVRAIDRMNAIGQSVPGRQEFFRGVTFEQAVQVLEEVCGAQGVVSADPAAGCDSLIAHAAEFCPGEPRNATQLSGGRL